MSFIINNQEMFQTNSSIHNMTTRNKKNIIDQIPTYLFSKKYSLHWYKHFNSLPHNVTIFKNDKAKFKESLRKHLHTHTHTHSFYHVDEFFMCKDDLRYHFVKCL